jgi:hypothetical protein
MTILPNFCSQHEDQMICDDSLGESFDKENVNPNSSFTLKTKAAPFDFGGGCDIIYCKARGMPLDHIGNNATLQFQKGYECVHGAELHCSHPSCKKDGVKFRFCQHCEKAVAKRNFRKRHAHPELLSLQEMEKNALPPLHPALLPSLPPRQNQQETPVVQNKTTSIKVEATHHIELYNPIFDYGVNLGTEQSRQRQMPIDLLELPSSDLVALATSAAPAETTSTIHTELPSQHFDIESIPQAWNDLFLNRPQRGSLIQQQEWLQQVLNVTQIMQQDSCSPKRSDMHVEDHGSISNSIEIVREEFSRNFPPQFINCEDSEEGEEKSKYRQHGNQMALTVYTDLELLGTNSLLLDSNGSIIIAYTPRSYREDSMCSPLHYNN